MKKKWLALLLAAVMTVGAWGCGQEGGGAGKEPQPGSTAGEQTGAGAGQEETGIAGRNKNKEFRILHNWTKEGIANHYHGGTAVGPLEWFAVEGLMQYIRTADTIYYTNAESIEHNADGTSVIHIRPEAKWQNGDDFLAEDVLAFWTINHTQLTNNISNMEAVDEKTVKLTWKAGREPNEQIKNLLIAQDKVASVQYKEFKEWVDKAAQIRDNCKAAAEDYTGWAPFGKIIDEEAQAELNKNYNEFKSHNPDWFMATGPYMLDKVTETQMILRKNENYWAADNLGFETIYATNSMADLNQVYNQLAAGEIDYQDGLAPVDTINSILDKNQNMAHYKMADPGTIGLVFNLEKPIWTDEVREAFQYIFDRDEMRKAGNYYGITAWSAMTSMAPTDVEKWVGEEDRAKIKQYQYDTAKAEEMLLAAGWTKDAGKWCVDGKPLSLTMGYDGSHPGMTGVAEAASSALNNFGIEVKLKKFQDWSTWFAEATKEDSTLDIAVNWVELNMSFSYPGGSFIYMYNDINAHILHIPRVEEGDRVGMADLTLNKADGSGTFEVADVYTDLYYIIDENELKQKVADLVVGLSEKNYGIPFYQNVTGSFMDLSMLSGTPYLDKVMAEGRNITYIPAGGTEDYDRVAEMNFYFSQAGTLIQGILQPNTP